VQATSVNKFIILYVMQETAMVD